MIERQDPAGDGPSVAKVDVVEAVLANRLRAGSVNTCESEYEASYRLGRGLHRHSDPIRPQQDDQPVLLPADAVFRRRALLGAPLRRDGLHLGLPTRWLVPNGPLWSWT